MIFRAGSVGHRLLGLTALLVLAGTSGQSAPEVTSTGFLVKLEASINAPAAKVYEALIEQIGSWWNPDHTYSHDAKNLSIDPRPGGCFCEKLPNGGGVEHLRVVYIAAPQLVRFSGTLGPLQASGLAGSMTWKLNGSAKNTRVQLSYSVGGFIDGGFEKIAPAVESMLSDQLNRLKLFVETGKPAKTE
jgi:uncharacterized protein YndB with AHSA1/START domain